MPRYLRRERAEHGRRLCKCRTVQQLLHIDEICNKIYRLWSTRTTRRTSYDRCKSKRNPRFYRIVRNNKYKSPEWFCNTVRWTYCTRIRIRYTLHVSAPRDHTSDVCETAQLAVHCSDTWPFGSRETNRFRKSTDRCSTRDFIYIMLYIRYNVTMCANAVFKSPVELF